MSKLSFYNPEFVEAIRVFAKRQADMMLMGFAKVTTDSFVEKFVLDFETPYQNLREDAIRALDKPEDETKSPEYWYHEIKRLQRSNEPCKELKIRQIKRMLNSTYGRLKAKK